MKFKYLFLLFLPLLFSCADTNRNSDRQVDSGLGVEENSENQDARSALQNLQQTQQQEQRRQLERQITDPLTGS